jgi:Na+/H+ antiporter NhaD/arsenite permease-like protein
MAVDMPWDCIVFRGGVWMMIYGLWMLGAEVALYACRSWM